MIKIKSNKIKMTRGDTLITSIDLKVVNPDETESPYIPEEGDVIFFAVKHPEIKSDNTDYVDQNPLILKEIPTSTMELRLDPIDTKSLAYGDYVYDIEITYADGIVYTFLNNMPFELVPEVYK